MANHPYAAAYANVKDDHPYVKYARRAYENLPYIVIVNPKHIEAARKWCSAQLGAESIENQWTWQTITLNNGRCKIFYFKDQYLAIECKLRFG